MKEKIDTKVEPELAKRIRDDAKTQGRSFSGQIRWMLEEFYRGEDEVEKDWEKVKTILNQK